MSALSVIGNEFWRPGMPIHCLVLLLCYAIGCVVTAWYLVRWRTGADLRGMHSGTTGARNAGRVLGRGGFVIVALLDGLRGLLAMSLAAAFGLREWWLTAAGLAVLAGHLWPPPTRLSRWQGHRRECRCPCLAAAAADGS